MHAFFVHAAKSPLTRVFQAAASTAAARNFDRDTSFGLVLTKDELFLRASSLWIIGSKGTEAGHLETNSATHGGRTYIFYMSMASGAGEGRFRFCRVHFMTTHRFFLGFGSEVSLRTFTSR